MPAKEGITDPDDPPIHELEEVPERVVAGQRGESRTQS